MIHPERRRENLKKIEEMDKTKRTCRTCPNAFVDEDQYHDIYLCCAFHNGDIVDDDDSCDDWGSDSVLGVAKDINGPDKERR